MTAHSACTADLWIDEVNINIIYTSDERNIQYYIMSGSVSLAYG